MKNALKTILIAGNHAGEQFNSTTIGNLGDCLQTIGYYAQYVAIDMMEYPRLKTIHQDTYCYKPDSSVGDVMATALFAAGHISIIDCPGASADKLATQIKTVRSFGVRVVVGIIVDTQSKHSLECGIEFANTFAGYTREFIIMANEWDDTPNVLIETPEGKQLIKKANGRVIKFPPQPRLTPKKPRIRDTPIAAVDNIFMPAFWNRYREQMLKSVSPHAEWLAGKPL
jgi:hypothetical protein